jgi:ubiquinone/menaquinone biosynthesis C-methylase UbiE
MSKQNRRIPTGWDGVAYWYDGWMGEHGSDHHQKLAIPATLALLNLNSGEHVLDIGAGQGVLAPYVTARGAEYTGVEVSPKLLSIARRQHGKLGCFVQGDARRLAQVRDLTPASFDAAVFLLSIQDMNPLARVLQSAAQMLRSGGRLVILMTHPCFHIPRQSGWGYDESRHLRYRRIDRYLTPLSVPMKPYTGKRRGVTISFHRPLGDYVNELAACGLLVDCLREITTYKQGRTKAEQEANSEIPVFLGLRALKME